MEMVLFEGRYPYRHSEPLYTVAETKLMLSGGVKQKSVRVCSQTQGKKAWLLSRLNTVCCVADGTFPVCK